MANSLTDQFGTETNPVGWSSTTPAQLMTGPRPTRESSNTWLPGGKRPLFQDELEGARNYSLQLFQTAADAAGMRGANSMSNARIRKLINKPPSLPQRQISPEAIEAFNALASAQRGLPEQAMLAAQRRFNGGVMSHAIENVGDLTHRMAEQGGSFGAAYVAPKVSSVLNSLRNPYGFEKEFLENLYIAGVPQAEAFKLLQKYADAHKALPVYNNTQKWGRDAAVALGERRYADVESNLTQLERIIGAERGRFQRENLRYNPLFGQE